MLLRPLADDLWVADAPLVAGGFHLGTRMAVLRLPDGGLFLFSAVKLDEEGFAALESLGPVRYAVAPNKVHHLFIAPFFKRFPQAKIFAAPGLEKKRKDLPFHGVLGQSPEPGWAGVIDQHAVAGMPMLNEVVFFHRPSRTLLCTDLLFNIVHCDHWFTKLYLRLSGALGRPKQTIILRSTVRDKRAFAASMERILEWDFERIVLAHGEVIESGGREIFREATAWARG